MSARRPLVVGAATVTCATLAVLAVGSSALASSITTTSGQIKVCYKTSGTLPPLDHVAMRMHVPPAIRA